MVSIIVPVYNAENFLEETVRSVISQSFTDWELILIDDGSTDGSGKLADRLAAGFFNIKVIHKSNGGLSSARNAGLDTAKGDFIFFLDADDLIPAYCLEVLARLQENSKAGIVCGRIVKFNSEKTPLSHQPITYKTDSIRYKTFTSKEAIRNILYQRKINNSMSGKLFKASLWENIRFTENTYYEDLDIFYHVFLKASSIISISFPVYYYRQHKGSYLHNFNLGRKDMLEVTQRLTEFMTLNYPELVPAALSRQLSANFNMFLLLSAHSRQLKKEKETVQEVEGMEKSCWDTIKSLRVKVVRDPEVRIKNKVGILISYLGGRPLLRLLAPIFY